jgi:asparagine synthase (glutamine-hydrolysing)
MCGITGFNWPDKSIIEEMNRTIKHRGPDDEGLFVDENVSLGHRRLSIIDISDKGHQPMIFGDIIIVYNGEIYNFPDIKKELKSKGCTFTSETDTEVILKSYDLWGPDCVKKFNGMWAFCIYDKKNSTFFLSRDRFGKKPLYYYFDGQAFIFASSINAIRRHKLNLNINNTALNFFFYQKYIGDNLTIFNNCYKLRPSENILFDLKERKITLSKYYDLETEVARCGEIPLQQRLDSIANLINCAVEDRLIADVPVGSFLSGGVDSSLISAVISSKHNNFDTFSIGFKDKSYDELEYSKLVSEYIHTNHHYDYLQIDESLIQFIVKNMDEPFGDASVLPTYLLSKITRKNVTVSLSGDAGDEIFGGYDTYSAYKIARYFPEILIKPVKYLVGLLPPSEKKLSLSFKIKKFLGDYDANVNRRHLNWMATFDGKQRQNLLNDNFVSSDSFLSCSSSDSLLSIQLNDIQNYMAEDILKKVDYASMLNSLEVRVPFLDVRLVPLVLSLPEKYKIKCMTTKWLLKKIASKYLPEKIVNRRKRGFTVPITKWIKQSELIHNVLTSREFYQHNLINYDYVRGLFDAHMNNREDNARQLWLVFVFNYWWSENAK